MGRRTYTDIEILGMFVLRARRIAAHSLMADDAEQVRSLADSTFGVTVGLETEMSFTTQLPPQEEQFESLAARLRPLILPSEPIHHQKVLAAIHRQFDEAEKVTRHMRRDLDRLAERWSRADPESGELQAWSAWTGQTDGAGPHYEATDSVLALGWLYSDLVHVELRPDRAVAAEFPMSQRYLAASQVLSRVALAAIETLTFVGVLDRAGVLDLAETLWIEDVVAPEVMEETGRLYLGAPGTEIPEGATPMQAVDSFSLATLTSLSRIEGRRADILFVDVDGTEMGRHEGAVIDLDADGDARTLSVLVEDSVRIDIYVETNPNGQAAAPAQVNGEIVAKTNRALRAHFSHIVNASQAHQVVLAVEDLGLFAMPKVDAPASVVAFAKVYTRLLDDIIAIEDISGTSLSMLTSARLTPQDLIGARRVRLLMEGKILSSGINSLRGRASEQPADGVPIVFPAEEARAAGVKLPALKVAYFAANTTVSLADDHLRDGEEKPTWLIETTDGTPFLMASIDHAAVGPEEISGPMAELGLEEALALFAGRQELSNATLSRGNR